METREANVIPAIHLDGCLEIPGFLIIWAIPLALLIVPVQVKIQQAEQTQNVFVALSIMFLFFAFSVSVVICSDVSSAAKIA